MIETFLRDPLVQPLWAFALLSLAVFVLTVWRAIEAGQFDVHKLPQLLDTLVLRKLVPLAVLGIVAKTAVDPVTSDALTGFYLAGVLAAAAAAVAKLIDAVKGQTFPPEISMTDGVDG